MKRNGFATLMVQALLAALENILMELEAVRRLVRKQVQVGNTVRFRALLVPSE